MTNQTMKKKAALKGHTIGRIETRVNTRTGQLMYRVGWCQVCHAAIFSDGEGGALHRNCFTQEEIK